MEITERIHLLRHNFIITLENGFTVKRFVNSLIIFDDELTVIDTGVKGSFEEIKKYIESKGKSVADVKNIILTHAHPDHIGSAFEIKNKSNCCVYSHVKERDWIENINLQVSMRPVPGFFSLVDNSVKIDKLLTDGESLNLGNITLNFIHSPGHSPGLLNVFFREDNILFTSDSIPLKGDIPNYHNYKELIQSIDVIMNNPVPVVLLSSWEKPFFSRKDQMNFLTDGLNYVNRLNTVIKEKYINKDEETLENCRRVIETLNLPQFMINPIVDKSFRSHF